jgi:hypothetical protein
LGDFRVIFESEIGQGIKAGGEIKELKWGLI